MPNKVAVRSRKKQLTYGELDSLSDKVATSLRGCGIVKGDRVGIYVPKSLASAIGIYSILKAGGVYVPFDPDAPPERLAYVAQDCGLKAVISCTEKLPALVRIVGKESPIRTVLLVDIDSQGALEAPEISEAEAALRGRISVVEWDEIRSDHSLPYQEMTIEADTAYILYTSGSTGVPKGVMISHRNSLAFVTWASDCVTLDQDDVVACHAPLHFDISTFSIFSTCMAGGTVLMIPEKASVFPAELAGLIEEEGVTVWYSVPSVLILLTLYGNLAKRSLSRLRAIIFAGEVFPVKFLGQLISQVPQARYLNWYGPTETNVCTWYEVLHLDPRETESIPIGKACANTEVFALDGNGKLVAGPRETGELFVRGPTVMQGYWGDQDKTAKLLVRNPLNPTFEERVYKTGDIVTLDPKGNYLYLGRRDGMIKSRGYRIELSEIEAVIYSHPGVKEVVVVPVPDELVGNRIYAFVSPEKEGTLSREGIQTYCSTKLPKYMVPEGVAFRENLPKTSSGKMDRVALARDALGTRVVHG